MQWQRTDHMTNLITKKANACRQSVATNGQSFRPTEFAPGNHKSKSTGIYTQTDAAILWCKHKTRYHIELPTYCQSCTCKSNKKKNAKALWRLCSKLALQRIHESDKHATLTSTAIHNRLKVADLLPSKYLNATEDTRQCNETVYKTKIHQSRPSHMIYTCAQSVWPFFKKSPDNKNK